MDNREIIEAMKLLVDQEREDVIQEGIVSAVEGAYARIKLRGSASSVRAVLAEGATVQVEDKVILAKVPSSAQWVLLTRLNPPRFGKVPQLGDGVFAPPLDVAAVEGSGVVGITWNHPVMVDVTFVVQINDAGSADGNESVFRVTQGSYALSWVSGGTTKYFRVRSVNQDGGTSGWSAWVEATAEAAGGSSNEWMIWAGW